MTRDEPIDTWTVFRKDDNVHYWICNSKAVTCTSDSKAEDVAEKRDVPYNTWLGELARQYQLDAKVLLNGTASARRIDATIAALKGIVAEDSDASNDERREAKEKLDALTKKGGYKDRFTLARTLSAAVEKGKDLELEASDRRATHVRWPLNFDFKPVVRTEKTVRTTDILTELEWIVPLKTTARRSGITAACEALEARVPTAAEAQAATPWLVASPLGKELERTNSKTVGAEGPAFWLPSAGSAVRVEPEWRGPGVRPATAEHNGTKAYHFWEGRFELFDFGGTGVTRSYSPAEKVYPRIVSEQSGTTYIRIYEVVKDPSSSEVLAKADAFIPALNVLCVRARQVDER